MNYIKLSEYAKKMQVEYGTAYRWFKNNQLTVKSKQLPTGTILVEDPNDKQVNNSQRTKTAIYARVSLSEQRQTNLETQALRLCEYAAKKGYKVDQIVKEVGSGLNDQRPKLIKLLKDPTIKRIIVEHRDRLTRFGFNYLQTMADVNGFEIEVVNKTLVNDSNDLMADFTAIITSFCSRLYAKRRAEHKAAKLRKELTTND